MPNLSTVKRNLVAVNPREERTRTGVFCLSASRQASEGQQSKNSRQNKSNPRTSQSRPLIGRLGRSNFITINNRNSLTTDPPFWIQAVRESVALKYHRLCEYRCPPESVRQSYNRQEPGSAHSRATRFVPTSWDRSFRNCKDCKEFRQDYAH